ncbi:MAG: ATP-dependent DNA ligase [bacterium]
MMLFDNLVEYSKKIRETRLRNEKINIIVQFLRSLSKKDSEIGANFISGKIRQGKLNLAWKSLSVFMNTGKVSSKPVNLLDVDRYLDSAKRARGGEKVKVLVPLFEHLSVQAREYLVALILNDLHQGAGEGLVKLAIAKYFGLDDSEIEQAYLQNPDLGFLFKYLVDHGKTGIRSLSIVIFRPVKPMLAEISSSMKDLVNEFDGLSIEYKLDGIRVQVHRDENQIKIFSRNLKDISVHFPEVVDIAKAIPVKRFILDGEAIGVDRKGRPVPFQVLGKRTMRKEDIAEMMEQVPVIPKFFDVLYFDREDLTAKTYIERQKILSDIITDKNYLATKTRPINKQDIDQFFNRSVESGNEGIVAKFIDSPYRPGKRGKYWYKFKQIYTIDCVVLAAEWGHGRRKGLLSNIHLGILDETKTKYLMVGKTFKGLTDKMLVWFTQHLPALKVHEDAWTVYVQPVIVVEIAFNEVQKSPKYDSGFALRFARVKHIRNDKTAKQINTIMDLVKLRRCHD